MAQWDLEKKMAALAIAETATIREASEQTGVPVGTIKRWRSELRASEPSEPNPDPEQQRKKVQAKVQAVVEKVMEETQEHVAAYALEKGKTIADQLMSLIELSIREAAEIIKAGPAEDEARAQWLRSVIGAIAQGVKKYQLLTGKATSRTELIDNPFAGLSTEELRELAAQADKPVN